MNNFALGYIDNHKRHSRFQIPLGIGYRITLSMFKRINMATRIMKAGRSKNVLEDRRSKKTKLEEERKVADKSSNITSQVTHVSGRLISESCLIERRPLHSR